MHAQLEREKELQKVSCDAKFEIFFKIKQAELQQEPPKSSEVANTGAAVNPEKPTGATEVFAEMDAVVWRVTVKEGSSIRVGDPLVILQAMKMEIEVLSELEGVVLTVTVKEGQLVSAGTCLCHVTTNNSLSQQFNKHCALHLIWE